MIWGDNERADGQADWLAVRERPERCIFLQTPARNPDCTAASAAGVGVSVPLRGGCVVCVCSTRGCRAWFGDLKKERGLLWGGLLSGAVRVVTIP